MVNNKQRCNVMKGEEKGEEKEEERIPSQLGQTPVNPLSSHKICVSPLTVGEEGRGGR